MVSTVALGKGYLEYFYLTNESKERVKGGTRRLRLLFNIIYLLSGGARIWEQVVRLQNLILTTWLTEKMVLGPYGEGRSLSKDS